MHAARRETEKQDLAPKQREEAQLKGRQAVQALCDSLQDKSALFRHEICFVFGELAHASCVPAMLKVLGDDKEHEMVRHEAAEALGAVVEEGDATEAGADEESLTGQVMKELKRWAEDMQAPRVVRESCVVALDEMACEYLKSAEVGGADSTSDSDPSAPLNSPIARADNNDPSQFQPMDNALPEQVAAA